MFMVPPEAPLLQRVWQAAAFSCSLLLFCGGTVQAQGPSRGLSEQERQRLILIEFRDSSRVLFFPVIRAPIHTAIPEDKMFCESHRGPIIR